MYMVNHFLEIVQEQVDEIMRSELYEASEQIRVGCLGTEENKSLLVDLLARYPKFTVDYFGLNTGEFEFCTLRMMKEDSNGKEPFHAFYLHTKGVSYPKEQTQAYIGGNYWRHYMNYYNIVLWQDCVKILERGNETCGVKFLTANDIPAHLPHYSGNFYWAQSLYIKKLPMIGPPLSQDRYEAEFWIGRKNPIAATMCQEFVDYNTNKIWRNPNMNRTIVHTLCFNLVSEVEKAVIDLYAKNDKEGFHHIIVDLGYPLEEGDKIPEDIDVAKERNSMKLRDLAQSVGSEYLQLPNVGVSQNWTAVARHVDLKEGDVMVCADPDERVETNGWVKALADVIREQPSYGWVSLVMPEHMKILNGGNTREFNYGGHRVWELIGNMNWAQGALSGRLFEKLGEVPFLVNFPVYGHIEAALLEKMPKFGFRWCMLPDYIVRHTDDVPLYRAWKDQIIFRINEHGQLSFEKWLEMKRKGEIE